MPSKLRKAIGAVKDQTSISFAKVTNAANLEIAILKATTHDKSPIEERYVNEIVGIVSSNKLYAAACANCIGKRIGKTRNWVVVLKSLMIVLRIFQDGDPYFPREVFHAMKRGARILNLSTFKDDSSSSSPWDYSAFIRTFSLYLDERLDCFLTGKLQRRFNYHNLYYERNQRKKNLSDEPGIRDMKPTMVLDRMSHWQRLLDRAIATRPTGAAKTNRLVQISLYAIVQESFDLYRDISDGLAVVLDSFFHLPLSSCAAAFHACAKSSKQFDELSRFYNFCVNIGIGRSYEYPTVQKVSEELMETLQEFLKDQANDGSSNSKQSLSPVPKYHSAAASSSSSQAGGGRYGTPETHFESGSEIGSQCTSLEDLMSATDAAMSPRRSLEQDTCSEQSDSDQDEKHSQYDDEFASANGSSPTKSFPVDQTSRSSLDIISFEDMQQDVHQNQIVEWEPKSARKGSNSNDNSKDCWELVLAETVTAPAETLPELDNSFDPFATLFDQAQAPPQHKYNPFLEDLGTVSLATDASYNNFLDMAPTFQATTTSTFSDQSSNSFTNLDLIFGDTNPYDTRMAPTFQCSAETSMTAPPTFHTQTSDKIIVQPSFQAQHSFKNDSTGTFQCSAATNTMAPPTFHTQTFDNMIVTPSFQAQSSFRNYSTPTFQVVNSNVRNTMEAPTHSSQNLFGSSIVQVYNSTAAPTFSAKDYHQTTLALPAEEDPFGPWPCAKSNEQTSNVSMQNQNLLQLQQLWLEQQNKIIAKHMT